ncbi:MAG TPA: MOSC domain-containing protein [Blastocatellia bacterium]|nr:MOSC domain-containing protein [Blastocatellia bacterium]HMV83428.1 MOSC domain-containing protein [Blastocatellia bacterium]HMX24097.1 MOSC domain-containing protein [Blastocatellia bacterium]HMY72064.1 MOSC domain-containing protein [Blastocatellia bacterium]HNG28097.1 MOSC domain-containing protein [Blastocatellia bacterium]
MSEVTGKITGVYVGKQNGGGKTEVSSAELIAGHGLLGDNHAGRDSKRQISLFTQETLEQLLAEGFGVTPAALSANFFTVGIKLNSLKPGMQLRVGETLLEIVEARKPCRSIARIDNRLPKRLYGQCGQLASIIKGGNVKVGDDVEIVADQRQMSFGF